MIIEDLVYNNSNVQFKQRYMVNTHLAWGFYDLVEIASAVPDLKNVGLLCMS